MKPIGILTDAPGIWVCRSEIEIRIDPLRIAIPCTDSRWILGRMAQEPKLRDKPGRRDLRRSRSRVA